MRRLNQTLRTVRWVSWTTRLPAVLLLCLSVLTKALSHSPQRGGQSYPSRGRVEAQQQYHPLQHSVQDPTPLSFKARSSLSSPPLLLTSPQLQLFRRHSGTRSHSHNIKERKTKKYSKHENQEQRKHCGPGSKTGRHCSESSENVTKKSRKKTLSSSHPLFTKQKETKVNNEHKRISNMKAKTGGIKSTFKNKILELSGRKLKKASAKTFRKSTFHKHGKQYLFTHEDWYTQYRRNRSGPSSVMRKLTLESSRRRKAMVTIEPVEPLNDDSIGSIEQEYGSPNALPSSLRGNGVIEGQETEEEDTEDMGGNGAGANTNRTPEIQGVKRPQSVSAGLAPRPIIVRPVGLIPKARSNGGSSSRMTSGRDTAVRTEAIVVLVAVALLCSGMSFL